MRIKPSFVVCTLVSLLLALWANFIGVWAQTEPSWPPNVAEGWWEKKAYIAGAVAATAPAPSGDTQPAHTVTASTGVDDWWLLVFQSQRDGNWEIYRNTLAGTVSTRLTYHPANDTAPQLSPDAGKIVFVSNRDGNDELYVMQADGSNQTRLTYSSHREQTPAWSPNGTQIAYVSYEHGNADIYLINADGSNRRALNSAAAPDLFPAWSPDGGRILFVRASNNEFGKLWVMNVDGSNAAALTGDLRYLSHPRWSPDGSTIAFDYDATNDYFNELGLVNADGSNLRQLNRSGVMHTYEEYWLGAWTPDSQQVVYSYIRYDRRSNRLIVADLRVERLCVNPNHFCLPLNLIVNLDHAPDVRSLDSWPPVSQANPMPPYTRRQQFDLTWQAYDVGPAGINTVERQYRTADSSEWRAPLQAAQGDASAAPAYPQTGKLYFRTRAIDKAGNVEAWPASDKGDAETTFYSWLLTGHLTDARGVGRAQRTIPLQPAAVDAITTDTAGAFLGRLPTNGLYQLNGTTRLDINGDRQPWLYTLPSENLIQNGGFESKGAASWQVADNALAQVLTGEQGNGSNVLRLGINCASPCLALIPPPALPNHNTTRVLLLPGSDNTLHLVVNQGQHSLFYLQRKAAGDWGPVEPIANGAISTIQAVVDSAGVLHLLWQPQADNNANLPIHYSQRANDGSWHSPVEIGAGSGLKLLADEQNGLHLLYLCSKTTCGENELRYRYRSPAGAWSADTLLASIPEALFYFYSIYGHTVDKQGNLHVIWSHFASPQENGLYYRERAASGHWQPAVNLKQQIGIVFTIAQIIADPQGTLHLFWDDKYYTSRPVGGQWAKPAIIHWRESIQGNRVLMDRSGALHWLTTSDFGSGFYYYKAPGQPWSAAQPSTIGDANSYDTVLVAGAANMLYSAKPAYTEERVNLAMTMQATKTMTSTVSQVVAIPSTLHAPTLSFLYTLAGGGGASHFTARVSAGMTTTQVFSTTTNGPWALGWADLTPWSGETVTVTFALHQVAGESLVRAYLDDVALGAWTTPVPHSITPAQLPVSATATFTITGENFIATPTITLVNTAGNTALTNVRQLDAKTLQADLPAGIGPGRYDLWVTNPGGETTPLTSAVQVGQAIYLPVIAR